MPAEVVQPPHLLRPNLSDPTERSGVVLLHCAWLRFVAPQLGCDIELLLQGGALNNILGDDENAFGLPAVYNRESTNLSRELLFIRMDWEIGLSELPEHIRTQIMRIRQKLEDMDWNGRENFEEARNIWVIGVKKYTEHLIDTNRNLREACEYDSSWTEELSPYWKEFIYGFRLPKSDR